MTVPFEATTFFSLRPYQLTALDTLHTAIQQQDILLLQAATGSGKTVMVVRMIQRYYYDHPDRRFLIIMHKKELAQQFITAFKKFTSIPDKDIGIACSGLQKTAVIDQPITIASVQTLINKVDEFPGVDLVVVDETHRIGHDHKTRYRVLLNKLRQQRPQHKLIGVTATAYRLGHGMIYGDKCRPERANFFPELTHRITYNSLVADNYLMELKGFVASSEAITEDLENVRVDGDYNLGQLGDVMSKTVHINSAVDGFEKYGMDHQSVCVFACTIKHAEALCNAFKNRGHSAVVIHSKLQPLVRDANIRSWQSGEARIAVSINILIEGFDFPALSCLVFCRPTKSPTVFVQAIGRILRKAPDKKEALLIDLTNNTSNFGTDLDNPIFVIPEQKNGDGEAPVKTCPGELAGGEVCGCRVHASLIYCPECGFRFTENTIEEKDLGKLEEVIFNEPEKHTVKSVDYLEHQSKKSNKRLMKVVYHCGTILNPVDFYDWVCLPDFYTGYVVNKARKWWNNRTIEPFPETVEEAIFLSEELDVPLIIQVIQKNGFGEITDYDFGKSLNQTGLVVGQEPHLGVIPFQGELQ